MVILGTLAAPLESVSCICLVKTGVLFGSLPDPIQKKQTSAAGCLMVNFWSVRWPSFDTDMNIYETCRSSRVLVKQEAIGVFWRAESISSSLLILTT